MARKISFKRLSAIISIILSGLAAYYSYGEYRLNQDNNDKMAQVCGSVVDARSSFLEVGAEASTHTESQRSKSRDQLDSDLRKLTEAANRTSDLTIRQSATNARIALARALNLNADNMNEHIVKEKLCLVVKFFTESESISKECRKLDLPATPKPKDMKDMKNMKDMKDMPEITSACPDIFSSDM